jgi:hypothetical protein
MLAQNLGHVFPGAIIAPLSIMVEDRIARRILVRQQSPLCSGAQQVKDRIDDAPQGIGLPPPGGMTEGHQRFKPRPFRIGEIAGVRTDSHGTGSQVMEQPASAVTTQHQIYAESNT